MPVPHALSVDPSDPRYSAVLVREWLGRVEVQVDGVEQRNVVTYDVPAGLVVRAELDPAGRLVLAGEQVALERVSGNVTVVDTTT